MMSQRAIISFVKGSTIPSINLEGLQEQLMHYKEQAALTGRQLSWEYEEAAFPYTITSKPGFEDKGLILQGNEPIYRCILLGTGTNLKEDAASHYVEVVLPDTATSGDKSKANELCRYLAKTWKAELQLFNGRVMYCNPRK